MGDTAGSPLSKGLVLGFYGAMLAGAYLVAWLFDVPSLWRRAPGPLPEWLGLVLGVLLGLLAHGLGALAGRRFAWARSFYERMAELMGPLTHSQVVLAAAASGVAEEALFRGALQPIIGLVPQAVVFGLIHLGPGPAFRFWPFYAALMGLAFGGLYEASGTLLAPILAHFTVNYFGLSTLLRR